MDADLTDFGTHPSTWVSSPATLEAMGASKSAPAGSNPGPNDGNVGFYH